MPVLSRRFLSLSSVIALVSACDPLSCQGRVETQNAVIVDVPDLPPKCDGGSATFVGDVDVTNQAQLDTLINCQTVEGSIIIHDSIDIVDVGALSKLQSLNGGYFLAFNNTALTNIQLPAFTLLDTGFAAIDNPELTAVNLPELITFKGDLTMRNNPKQTQLAIPKVERLDNSDIIIEGAVKVVSFGNLILGDLPSLTTLQGGFDNLETLQGSLNVFNTGLTNFTGLEKLVEILNTGGAGQPNAFIRTDKLNPGLSMGIDFDADFNIVPAGNPAFVDFSGLDNLNTINGDVFIGFNPELTSFNGLDDVKTISGNFTVVENDKLENFLGLEGDNDNDGNDDGLSVINARNEGGALVGGNFFIGVFFDRFGKAIAGGNDNLVNLDGLQSLTTITGDLTIGFNGKFEDLTGLELFTTLGKNLNFLGENLDNLKGAPLLTTIGGDLNFGQLLRVDGQPFNPDETVAELKLTDVFDKNTTVSTAVKFNPTAGQKGFDAVTTVNGNLIVAFSDITDLQFSDPDGAGAVGPANLTTVGKSLILYGNAAPDSLEGIQTLNSLGGLVVNFAIDAFGDFQPFENNGFNDFGALDVDLGAGGLAIGFDNDIDDAAFGTLRNFGTIGGDVILASVDNQNNRGPTDLNALNVANITGDLVVCAIKNGDDAPIASDLDNLTALNLNATNAVGGSVVIAFCSALTNTAMSITNVGGTFELTDLPGVETVNGLGGLGAVGELLLHDLPEVVNINIPALANVTRNLEIVNDPKLENFDLALNAVGGTVRLIDLGELVDLTGLTGLNTVGGDLEILDCETVADTNGLNQLDSVTGNLVLRRLDSISNEARVGGLQELSFNQLNQVGGLEVTQMADIEDLAGFEGVSIVDGTLAINANPKLKTLFGLQGIGSIGRKLSIVDNPELELPFFDDDNQDREPDVDNQNGVNNEPEDPDATAESGLGALTVGAQTRVLLTVGDPILDGEVVLGGQTGVIELRNNPKFPEADFVDEVIDGLDNYAGLLFFCGNDGTVDANDAEARLVSFATCAEAQDGLIDVVTGAGGAGAGEGEGE